MFMPAPSTVMCEIDWCVCADQWNVELGETLETSPFFEALGGAKDTLVMLDRSAELLTRLWVRTTAMRVVPVLQGGE